MPAGKVSQLPTLTPEQQQLQNQIISGYGGGLPDIFKYLQQILSNDPEAFAAFEAPYRQDFERNIIPEIAERFGAASGSHGALASSGLNQSLAQAGTDLSTNLAALRAGLKGQAINQLQQFGSPSFQSSFENLYEKPTESGFSKLLQGLGGGVGLAAGGGLTSGGGNIIQRILGLLSGRGGGSQPAAAGTLPGRQPGATGVR